MKKNIITYGTFDMFHIGHVRLLNRLRLLGSKLIVAVSTDEFNNIKGKKTLIPYKQRIEILKNIRSVDLVIPETSWEQKEFDIQEHNIDIFAIGDDWRGKFDYLSNLCEVKYIPRTDNISTTMLKKSLLNFSSISKEDIFLIFDIIEKLKSDLT